MTTDDELRAELAYLGLNERSFRAIALLPLVEVAWADRTIQDQEKQKIIQIARGHKLLTRNGAEVLKAWLSERPAPETFARGRKLLVALAHHEGTIAKDMPPEALETVLELCVHVAEAAGGLFGVFWTTSGAEKSAIRAIGRAIDEESKNHRNPQRGIVGRTISMDWRELMGELDE
jgi:tellurite resistance protein